MLKRMIKEVKKRALVFTDSLDFFFRKERDYNEENLILEERVWWSLTMQCNSMLHFGRDEGIEMAAAYHGVISTVRQRGKWAWDFLGEYFKNIFNDCKDFVNLIPQNIELVCTNG